MHHAKLQLVNEQTCIQFSAAAFCLFLLNYAGTRFLFTVLSNEKQNYPSTQGWQDDAR